MPVRMPSHPWKFLRAGGFDQVQLSTGIDLVNLGQLDQKLWVALAWAEPMALFVAKVVTRALGAQRELTEAGLASRRRTQVRSQALLAIQ